MYIDILAFGLVLFLSFVWVQNRKDPKKLFGIYSQPGKWYFLKYPLFLVVLVLRRLKYYQFGKEFFNIQEMERRQTLSDHLLAFDATFFHAVSQDGIFVCAGAERRAQGIINGLLYFKHPVFGLLKTPKLPETTLQEDKLAAQSNNQWAAEGLKFTEIEPMRKWHVGYIGKMRQENTETFMDVEIDANFVSDLPWFSYDYDLPASVLARSIARETWTREYFQSLKEHHQCHYEQHGFMEGTIKINGKSYPLKLDGFRDHSFGKKRDWSKMHRYIYMMFYLENQTRIVLGLISQPSTGSHYEMGYVQHANGKIDAIQDCDIRLWQHGENGKLADDLAFVITTAANHTYECRAVYETTVAHYVGNNIEVKMYERFGQCQANGVRGKLISEWNYNNTSGRFDLNLDQ